MHSRHKLDGDFKNTARDVFHILMGRYPQGMSDSMTWVEMKNYRQKCKGRIDALENKIQRLFFKEKEELCSLQQSYAEENKVGISAYISTTTPSPDLDTMVSLKKTL